MLVRYDYIDLFFKQKTFTDVDLENLREAVEKHGYTNTERKAAMSYIDMNLAAYSIGATIPQDQPKKSKKSNNYKQQSKTKKTYSKKKKRLAKNLKNAVSTGVRQPSKKEYVSSEEIRKAILQNIDTNNTTSNKFKKSNDKQNKKFTRPLRVVRQFRRSKTSDEDFKDQVKKFKKLTSKNKSKTKRKSKGNTKSSTISHEFKPRKSKYKATTPSKGVYGALATSKSIVKIIYTRM
ncbi:hypothetical protein [Mesoflavibacter profundi]|uniref:hypothetical protein n=1 Tax=Mesoflavibacter profundi TaxID=2708110 RepID=UPI0035188824